MPEPAYFQGLWAADKKQISLNEEKVNSSEENIRRNSSPSFFSKTFIFVMDFAATILNGNNRRSRMYISFHQVDKPEKNFFQTFHGESVNNFYKMY